MYDKYIMSTNGISDMRFNIGDIVYAKKEKKTNQVSFYLKNGTPGEDIIGRYIETVRGEKRFVDKFDMPLNRRKAYMVCGIQKDETKDYDDFILEYIYQEDDTYEFEERYLYKDIIYNIENNRIVVCGFKTKARKIIVPDMIDGRDVYAIGNITVDGICLPLEMPSDKTYSIVLPETVKEIYPFAFMNKSVAIEFPKSLYYIGEKAFYGARIDHIDISTTSVDTIERECFAYSKIESIKLPAELSIIKREAFKYSELKEVEFNSALSVIEKEAFFECVLETNRTQVDMVEENAFTCDTPVIIKHCECISYDDIKYKIYGRLKHKDIITDKILEGEHIDATCECLKQVFFAADKDQKYEIVIEYDEEFGNDDEWLEYIKYLNSVRVNLYRVDEYDIERHFETYIPDYKDVHVSGRIEEGCISVKYDDGRIVGIKLSERYRYNYEDWVYNEFNSGEFSEFNPYLTLKVVFGVDEANFIFSEEECEEYKNIKERYDAFCSMGPKTSGEI